jgi:hypothetical protein
LAKLPKREELYALKTVKKSPTYFKKKLIRTTNTDEEYADKLFMEKEVGYLAHKSKFLVKLKSAFFSTVRKKFFQVFKFM